MRRFFKIALISILFLALAGGGALYYFTKVKKYDVADEQVDKIVEDPYSISFPEGTPLPEGVQKDEEGLVIVDKKGDFVLANGSTMSTDEWFSSPEYSKAVSVGTSSPAANADSQTTDGENASNNEGSGTTGTTASTGGTANSSNSGSTAVSSGAAGSSGGSSSGESASNGSGTKTPASEGETGSTGRTTAAAIKSRYSGSFDSLQGQAQSQLGALVGQAQSEYAAKKASGETVNPAYFYQKYSGAASSVEAKTDSAFNTLYNSMTSELKANGLSTSAADEYKAQYEATKEGLRNELMSKVTGG
ncbi:hypothetical protein M3221_10720 [Domibacillus indicus]|uniref:hypothetical protein n=1 Tax=Domibacillus indicus TaxID=1437523 RepID=UPI00203C8DE2|nr:hypothetical protein [Domibacillus indicus]MCM3788878.1 hypothetical protein [Domibacillus indicus]